MITQSYDLDAGALYVELSDSAVARTAQVDAGTLVDLDASGSVVGIEVIRPDRAWPLDVIIKRFRIPQQDASELRAYFPYPVGIVPPAHPATRVPVTVGLSGYLVRRGHRYIHYSDPGARVHPLVEDRCSPNLQPDLLERLPHRGVLRDSLGSTFPPGKTQGASRPGIGRSRRPSGW